MVWSCVHVCMCLGVCVHAHVCVYVCACVCMCVSVHVCACVCLCMCVCGCVFGVNRGHLYEYTPTNRGHTSNWGRPRFSNALQTLFYVISECPVVKLFFYDKCPHLVDVERTIHHTRNTAAFLCFTPASAVIMCGTLHLVESFVKNGCIVSYVMMQCTYFRGLYNIFF